jgi:hypothetical protein
VVGFDQEVTKRCRLSLLANSALVYEPKCGGGVGCGVSANEYSFANGAQTIFAGLSPYLTYGFDPLQYCTLSGPKNVFMELLSSTLDKLMVNQKVKVIEVRLNLVTELSMGLSFNW